MAKSPIKKLIAEDKKRSLEKGDRKDEITFFRQGVELNISLKCLDHMYADENEKPVIDGIRLTKTDKLKGVIHAAFELNRISHARQCFYVSKAYINFADINKLDPFSKEAFVAYFGAQGYLWGLVKHAERQHAHAFMYDDNLPIGVSEKTAGGKKRLIKTIFSSLNLPVFEWDKGLKEFSVAGQPKRPTQPFSSQEHNTSLRRLHDKFFLLAPIFLAEYKVDPAFMTRNSNIDLQSKVIAVFQKNEKSSEVDLSFLEDMSAIKAFQFMMRIGYLLFCHYTAFNDSVITSVRRPIEFVTEKVEGKISTYATVKGYKGRASKDVTAIVGEEVSEDNFSELHVEEYEEIFARIDKRSGATFLKILLELSATFNPDHYGLLFFQVNEIGFCSELETDFSPAMIGRELELFSDRRVGLAERFAENITTLLDFGYIEEVKIKLGFDDIRRVRKRRHDIGIANPHFVKMVRQLSVAFLQCFTNQSLRYAQLPLYYSEPDDKGKVTITCTVASDTVHVISSTVTLYADERYIPTFKKIADWAMKRHQRKDWFLSQIRKKKYNNKEDMMSYILQHTKRTPYLLPVGGIGNTTHFGLYPVSDRFLNFIGVSCNHFYNSLNASRFRLTTAGNEYRKGSEISAMAVLQNSKRVFEKHYANGHQGENNEIIAQAIEVLEEVIKGAEIEEAKNVVRENWKIDVLTFDEYKKKKRPSNPNGIHCEGKPDFNGNDHQLAQNQSKKLNVIENEDEIQCYQYDKCEGCMNAKLIEHPEQVYKFLSFLESLIDAAELHPENLQELEKRIESFEYLLSENISEDVIAKAEDILEAKGRYFMFA
jgi:hypothetical protein